MPIKREMLVRRDAPGEVAINETIAPDLAEGEALLQVEAFAVTANNVTYAVVGEQMRYWDFFPAAEGWGVVPVWGYARAIASRANGIAVGERVYGYLPMATHLVVRPGKLSPGLFRDMAPHRQPMSPVYNQYRRLAADPAHDPYQEDMRMLFEPLFLTSFLIEDSLRRAGWHHADGVVLTSASSKTALATAYVMRSLSPGIERIGLTSSGNIAFVERTGLYDKVITYDGLDALAETGGAVVIDFAGNADLLHRLYAALPDRLAFCLRVGATHHDERTDARVLAGPKPVWFFAPDAATALIGEIGQDGFNDAVAAEWRGFVAVEGGLVTVEQHRDMAGLRDIWLAQVAGKARPDTGHIVQLEGEVG